MRAIDADALKERIRRFLGIKSFDNLLPAEKAIVQQIDHMPTIQPEQRTGKWIKPTFIQNRAFDIVHCSECGGVPCGVDENTHYCPHCGAKMISEGKTCDCYSDGRCVGTKEIDLCSCGGNKSKCDFYENVRREGDAE